jgi:hypothetical protein
MPANFKRNSETFHSVFSIHFKTIFARAVYRGA